MQQTCKEEELTSMTRWKVVRSAVHRALPPLSVPSAYLRPSCSTKGCTL